MSTKQQKLVIVESPAKARTIAKFLGKGYKVEACNGHVRDLPKSQLGVDVENGFEPKYITIRGRGEVLEQLRHDAKNAKFIYLATDPDREGEAISWHLAHVLKLDEQSACRVEFHEITKNAVCEAIKHPRVIDFPRVNAQQARRVLDRLVGYKISPLLWAKIKKGLSAGRVQSTATKMVVDREDEIDAFVPEEYWTLEADLETHGQHFTAKLTGDLPKNEGEANEVLRRITTAGLRINAIRRSERKKNPQPPFTTSNLQQEASRKHNFSTSKTMQVAQQLYEGVDIEGEGTVGLISYIRTDSVRISDEAITAVRAHIGQQWGNDFVPSEPNVYKGRNRAQDAHEAIRPTDVTRTPEQVKGSLTRDQFNLYRLIYRRFVASQMNPAVFDTLTIEMEGEAGLTMRFYGEHKRFAGFTVLYEEGTDEAVESAEMRLPDIDEHSIITLVSAQKERHFTQPPAHFTEASLVRAMEERGIGRPSTYAPTISTIITRGYVSREQKKLYPTDMGRMVTEVMQAYFPEIVDEAFTAGMEDKLDAVEEENRPWREVISDFYAPFEKQIAEAESSMEKIHIEDEVSDEVCELCGAPMVYKNGRFGRFLACSKFPDCRNTKNILVEIGVPCPKCGAPLLEKMSRKGRKFYGCSGYPECDFVAWDRPVPQKCPQCGSYMVQKVNKQGTFLLCSNEECRHRIKVGEDEA